MLEKLNFMKPIFAKLILVCFCIYPMLTLAQSGRADLVLGIKDEHPYLYDNTTGKVIIPPIYDGVNSMTIHGYSVGKYRHKRNSMIKYCEENDYIRLRYNPYFFTVMEKNKWAIADTTGKPLSPFKYDMILPSSNKKIALAQIGKKFGLLNDKGEEILELKYQIPYICFNCSKTIVIATKFLSAEQKKIIITEYGKDWQWVVLGEDDAVLFGLDGSDMFFELDGLIGSVDSIGNIIIPFKYEIIKAFPKQYRNDPQLPLQCRVNDKWGLVDETGVEVVQCQYDTIGCYSDYFISVKKNNKWGWIEYGTWKDVIPCLYDEVGEISDGVFAVKLNNKWGYLNKDADAFTEFIFDSVGPFINGSAEAVLNGKVVRINSLGNVEE
jgi:hypothetical protein